MEDGLALRGGEGWAPPHARARTYDDVIVFLNTMFYDDRLHKLVWQRNVLARIFRQRLL